MKMTNGKLGFTLIELLVVITIIGILATGAVNVYTSQIQKARDSTRITDLRALVSGAEQLYQQDGAYPNAGPGDSIQKVPAFGDITLYLPNIPVDPRSNQKTAGSNFEYVYAVGSSSNGIAFQTYEFSILFENEGNTLSKSASDTGNDDLRLEQGINLGVLNTSINIPTNNIAGTWVAGDLSTYLCSNIDSGVATAAPSTCNTTVSSAEINPSILIIK